MYAVMTRALRLEIDDRNEPAVEAEEPEGFSASEFLGGRSTEEKKS